MTQLSNTLFTSTLSFYIVACILFYLNYKKGEKEFFSIGKILLKIAVASLSLLIISRFITYGYFPIYTFYETLIFLTLFGSISLLVLESYHPRYRRSFFFALPFLTFFFFVAGFFPQEGVVLLPELESFWLLLHIITIIGAYGALAVAFMSSLMYLVVDYYLKKKKVGEFLSRIPSLETLDNLNYFLVTIGFFLLTLSIILGGFWAEHIWGSIWRWEPKETWALITWLIYAAYLHARFMSGWRGKSIALLNIFGFSALMFNYIIIRFFFTSGFHVFY